MNTVYCVIFIIIFIYQVIMSILALGDDESGHVWRGLWREFMVIIVIKRSVSHNLYQTDFIRPALSNRERTA
ncbi:hypothetical protein A0G02_07510 [Pectobacterium peruviense]|nr:hypothetical protein A0G02_07510 [Pectobacterium peruviense]